MINTSQLFNSKIAESTRQLSARLMYGTEEISGAIRSVQITSGACGEGNFTVGAVFSSYIEVVIDECEDILEDKELLLQIGLLVDDESVEYVDIGYYTVTKPKSSVYSTTFTAVGRITSKLNKLFDVPAVLTLRNIANAITVATGITIVFNGKVSDAVLAKDITGMTCKEALSVIAGTFGGFATEDNAGNIVISKYNTASKISVNGDRMTALPEFNDYDYDLNGIKVVVSAASETEDGSAIEEVAFMEGTPRLTLTNEFMTAELFESFVANTIGYKYRPGTAALALGDPRLQPWDCLEVTDIKDNVYIVPCLNIVHTFDGGLTTTITAPGESESESSSNVAGPIAQQMERMYSALITAQEAIVKRLKADEILADDITGATGNFTKYLTGVRIIGDLIEAGTLKADQVYLKGSDGKYYSINTDFTAMPGVEPVEEEAIHGSVLVKESITADRINVTDLFSQNITARKDFYLGEGGALVYDSETDELTIRAKSLTLSTGELATKDDIENIQIGSRNLARNSKTLTFADYYFYDPDDTAIPSYHHAEAARVANRLIELKALYPNHIVLGTIADNHVDKTNEATMTSARHGAFALEQVGLSAQCDFVSNLGDNIAGNAGVDSDADYANAAYMRGVSSRALTEQEGFNLIGNHDKSSSTQKLFDLIGKYNNFDNHGTTQIRGYGYKDFLDKKVRVICLNTTDYWNIIGGNGMSYEQKDFLMKALDLSAKNDYASWTILILSHIPLDFLGGDYNKGADLKAILKAYNDGTTATITVNSDYARRQNESDKYSGTLTYNYAGKNAPKIINIHGHIHTNKYRKLIFIDDNTELDIMRIATPNSSFNGNASTNRYTEYGDYSITTAEANKIKKVAGTKADTAATFYFIDLDGQVVHCVGYGADIDRTIPYKDAAVYSITYNLTDVTASNSITAIVEDEAYSTTLSVGSGYELDTVKVTMGGVDVTSTVYSNGVVTIDNVTGDIIITAVAIDNYVPVWDISDRTAVTDVYELASQAHACVTSRHNYIYGISDQGQIDYKQISGVVVDGNDVTFKSAMANVNIGLPYQLEPGATYTVKATASQTARFRFATFDTTGKYVGALTAGSSGTNLSETFTANENAGYWTVIMLDVRTAGNTTTFSNISLTKISDGTGDSGGSGDDGNPDTPSKVTNLFSSSDADFVDGQILRSSGGTKSGEGFVSGYIEAGTSDTIYVSCPSGTDYSAQSAPIICLYDSSKTFLTGFYSSQTANVTIDSDGLGFSCKIAKSGTAFVRVQGQPTGAYSDFVVTKNEPIV